MFNYEEEEHLSNSKGNLRYKRRILCIEEDYKLEWLLWNINVPWCVHNIKIQYFGWFIWRIHKPEILNFNSVQVMIKFYSHCFKIQGKKPKV